MHRSRLLPWIYVAVLMAATAIGLFSATAHPLDDHFLYQRFVESLAAGRLDLTIPGFHGSDLFAVPLYWVTKSPIAQIHSQLLAAILLPLCGFLAGRSLYRSTWHGVVLATIVAMMPFISFVGLRGWTGAAYWDLMLLSIALVRRFPSLSGIAWGLAILTKPFAIVLAPLLFVVGGESSSAASNSPASRWRTFIPGLTLVLLYVLIQYIQAGRLIVGSHAEIDPMGFIQHPTRIVLNLAHSLQILFSVHNYYFPEPSLTGPGNMMHTSPLLIFLGLFAMLSPSRYFSMVFKNDATRMGLALLGGAVAGILMNALLDHMDHFYMEASVLLFILASLPVLRANPLWIPIALATLHFQWFYFFLNYQETFVLVPKTFFLVPFIIDGSAAVWVAVMLARNGTKKLFV